MKKIEARREAPLVFYTCIRRVCYQDYVVKAQNEVRTL